VKKIFHGGLFFSCAGVILWAILLRGRTTKMTMFVHAEYRGWPVFAFDHRKAEPALSYPKKEEA